MKTFHALNKRLSTLLPAVLVLAAGLSLIPAAGLACGLTITQNTTLNADLLGCTGDGIIIAEDGVTLDLNGHSIIGLNKERTAGIRVQGVSNVTIKNGSVSSFERGIYLTNADNAAISKVEVNASRYEGLMAYQSQGVHIADCVFSHNTRAAVWIYDSDAELIGNFGQDNPNRTFYLSGGRVGMSGNLARGGAYYSAFTFANGYTPSEYTLQDNLAEDIDGVGYLFAWGFAGTVMDAQGNSAVNTGGDECWTQDGIECPLDLNSDSIAAFCGNDVCETGESVCNCSTDCGQPPVEDCGDGIDNDCDGDIDCVDASCALDAICYAPPVPVPADCKLPNILCDLDEECCSGDCRINARGNRGGTCR